ncbi:unnamed protein product [Polarella glacialis]|uniref:Potassium channel domain-containing protein n=1 Tax=Polarella glacialis TaxID=89957 RepID=A0A813FR02_POLGL|nr:unnamed protein product [Polarella glacialis]
MEAGRDVPPGEDLGSPPTKRSSSSRSLPIRSPTRGVSSLLSSFEDLSSIISGSDGDSSPGCSSRLTDDPGCTYEDLLNSTFLLEIFSAVIVCLSLVLCVAESVPHLNDWLQNYWWRSVNNCFSLFMIFEFGIRISLAARASTCLKYICSSEGIIDAIVFIGATWNLVADIARLHDESLWVLQILRMLRVLKLMRYMKEFQMLFNGYGASRNSNFNSIPKGMWWATVTITTVGYGDIVPETVMGKVVAAMAMLMGYGMLAVPTLLSTMSHMHLSPFDRGGAQMAGRGQNGGKPRGLTAVDTIPPLSESTILPVSGSSQSEFKHWVCLPLRPREKDYVLGNLSCSSGHILLEDAVHLFLKMQEQSAETPSSAQRVRGGVASTRPVAGQPIASSFRLLSPSGPFNSQELASLDSMDASIQLQQHLASWEYRVCFFARREGAEGHRLQGPIAEGILVQTHFELNWELKLIAAASVAAVRIELPAASAGMGPQSRLPQEVHRLAGAAAKETTLRMLEFSWRDLAGVAVAVSHRHLRLPEALTFATLLVGHAAVHCGDLTPQLMLNIAQSCVRIGVPVGAMQGMVDSIQKTISERGLSLNEVDTRQWREVLQKCPPSTNSAGWGACGYGGMYSGMATGQSPIQAW